MTTNQNQKSRETGSILFVSLILSGILGLTLGSYLYWVRTQNVLVAESQGWNGALAVAEAGIEEGMAQVNIVFGTNQYQPSLKTNWNTSDSGVSYQTVTRTLASATTTNGFYRAVVIPQDPGPIIFATGTVSVPFLDKNITRVVKVTTAQAPAFGNAISALQNVVMKGNNIMVDSYDSFDPLHSTNGLYNPLTRKAGGDVSSTGGVIDVQNANVYGKLRTAPTGGYSVGANGRVGDLSWVGPGLEPGWYINDFNADFPDVTDPTTTGLAPTKIPSGTNTYILGNTSYYINGDLTLNANDTLYVAGNATLWITGNFNMKSQTQSYITIASGATLKIYVGTATGPAVSATFTQVNNLGNAASFQYYGLPSNTAMTWAGNSAYMGTVYAPEATFTLGGGGNSTTNDFQGACVVNSVTMNGHFNFHYDENLKRNGPKSNYTVSYWQEL
jgi:hypothetical protein